MVASVLVRPYLSPLLHAHPQWNERLIPLLDIICKWVNVTGYAYHIKVCVCVCVCIFRSL